jgi:hypothetical protein
MADENPLLLPMSPLVLRLRTHAQTLHTWVLPDLLAFVTANERGGEEDRAARLRQAHVHLCDALVLLTEVALMTGKPPETPKED